MNVAELRTIREQLLTHMNSMTASNSSRSKDDFAFQAKVIAKTSRAIDAIQQLLAVMEP